MTGLILATHGELGKALRDVVELLMGEQEAVQTIGFQLGDSLETLLSRFDEAFTALKACDEILIMTDIKGGSPCNAAAVMQTRHEHTRVIAGTSIPMLVQFFENRYGEMPLKQSVPMILEVGKTAACEVSLSSI